VADVTSELFKKILGNECWPELVPFVFEAIRQQNANTRLAEICVYMVSEITPVLADSVEHPVETFIALMKQSLASPSASLRLLSIRAVKSFALAVDSSAEESKLKLLMNEVLIAFTSLQLGRPEATEAYAHLIEIAQYVPSLFDDILASVLTEFIGRMKDPHGDVDSKTMALEMLLTLIEGIENFDQVGDRLAELFGLLMDYLLQIYDAQDWFMRCHEEDAPDFGDLHDLAIESFDRLASTVPSQSFIQIFGPYAQQWARDPDWKKRHAVLSVIGQMAEGCSAEISGSISELLQVCIQGLSDQHVRVRWAACQAIGLVADEVGERVPKELRTEVITKIMNASVIDDPGSATVQQHGLRCLINIIQQDNQPPPEKILDEVMK